MDNNDYVLLPFPRFQSGDRTLSTVMAYICCIAASQLRSKKTVKLSFKYISFCLDLSKQTLKVYHGCSRKIADGPNHVATVIRPLTFPRVCF